MNAQRRELIFEDARADAYAEAWATSARKCHPTTEWQWKIMERDYVIETDVMREAFIAYFAARPYAPTAGIFYALGLDWRGTSWQGVYAGAYRVREMIAKRLTEAGRPLPYVNTLWTVGGATLA